MQGILQDNNIMGTYLNDIDSKMANKYTTPRRQVHYLIKKLFYYNVGFRARTTRGVWADIV